MFHTKCVDGSTWDFTIHSPAIFAMLSFLDFRVARVALVKLSRLASAGVRLPGPLPDWIRLLHFPES